ncbi:MAG TPA: HIT family protein [Xanthobacteraceae bacterium]|nr:HIT family protein [Xanthobacteraceae bacterium]
MVSEPDSWSLHPQLARDTLPAGDMSLCQLRLMNDANFPWLLLVPRRQNAIEITDLTETDQAQLMREVAQTARALKASTACDKINVAAIGNVVSQLHVHVVARFRSDAAWPKPVWGFAPACAYEDPAREQFVIALRRQLNLASQG